MSDTIESKTEDDSLIAFKFPLPRPVTWDEMSKIFLYLQSMWRNDESDKSLFGHLQKACKEISEEG